MEPIIHLRQTLTFFDDPSVPFGTCGPPAHPEPLELPGSPGLPPAWPPAPSPAGGGKEWEQEIHRVSDCIRDLHHPSLNLFQFQ